MASGDRGAVCRASVRALSVQDHVEQDPWLELDDGDFDGPYHRRRMGLTVSPGDRGVQFGETDIALRGWPASRGCLDDCHLELGERGPGDLQATGHDRTGQT